jgi:hypothetical protein
MKRCEAACACAAAHSSKHLRHNVVTKFSRTTPRRNDVHIVHRQDCLNAIEYLTEFGYLKAQA